VRAAAVPRMEGARHLNPKPWFMDLHNPSRLRCVHMICPNRIKYETAENMLEDRPSSLELRQRAMAMSASHACVVVIDDDLQFRESLGRLLRAAGLSSRLFESIEDFLRAELPDGPTCLVLDVRLPGRSGLDFQHELAAASLSLPIVFITGHGDIPMSVRAMKGGAIEFLTKPFRDQDILDAVNIGLARDRARRENDLAVYALRMRFEELTPRERTILIQVVKGRLNKQIAGDMGITETTVKVHRSNMMRKIRAASVAELCRIADKLQLLSKSS
jgi:FixJ family two-component response regulator